MNYEQFTENARKTYKAFCDMEGMAKAILDSVPDLVGENERLEKENAKLKGEVEILQCVQGPSGYMELPLDADGKPIHIGDKMDIDGEAMTVLGYRLYNGELLLIVKKTESSVTFTPKPSDVRHFKYVPPDSWEKLEEAASMSACIYAGQADSMDCSECKWKGPIIDCEVAMRREIIDRARKIADAEREAKRDGE